MKYIPYCYLIGWSELNTYYYGVRYATKWKCLYDTGCHPDDFWVTYHTTSPEVEKFREQYGEPDIRQIRKTFKTSKEATQWEKNVLRRVGAPKGDKWLNISGGGGCHTEVTGKKISEGLKKFYQTLEGEKVKMEIGRKTAAANRGRKQSEETKRKRSEAMKGRSKSKEWIEQIVKMRRRPFKIIFKDKEWKFEWHKDALEILPDYHLQKLRKQGTYTIPRAHFKHQFKKGDVLTLVWL